MELQITDHMFQNMNKLMFSTQEKLFVNHERIVSSRYSIAVAQFFFSFKSTMVRTHAEFESTAEMGEVCKEHARCTSRETKRHQLSVNQPQAHNFSHSHHESIECMAYIRKSN